jgi:hypothetical protein
VALLAPDPRRIADPPAQTAADDRVSDLVAYASDASPYRLIPKAVVLAHDAEDVRRVLDYLSSSRTCELGMQQATGAPYRSIVQLLDEVTD